MPRWQIYKPALVSLMVLTATSPTFSQEWVKHFTFEVKNPERDELYYLGEETQTVAGEDLVKETTYFTPIQRKAVQTESCTVTLRDLQVKHYESNNQETGEQLKVSVKNAQNLEITHFDPQTMKEPLQKTMPQKSGFLGKILHQLMIRHWAELSNPGYFDFKLLVPHRFDSFHFKIRRESRGRDRSSFKMEIASFWLRSLAPTMEFIYSEGPRPLLLEYRGPSPIAIQGEAEKPVRVLFQYACDGTSLGQKSCD